MGGWKPLAIALLLVLPACGGGGGGGSSGAAPDPSAFIDFAAALVAPLRASGSQLLGDLNSDGRDDFVVLTVTRTDRVLETYLSNATGLPQPAFFVETTGRTEPVLLADFDSDGRLDLLVKDLDQASEGSFLRGDGEGRFSLANSLGQVTDSVTAADFNDDGLLDLVLSDTSDLEDADFVIRFGDGAFGFSEPTRLGFGIYGLVLAADFNGDGHMDILTHPPLPFPIVRYRYAAWLGDGHGAFSLAASFNDFARAVVPADVDGDGDLDIVETYKHFDGRSTHGHRAVRLNDGTGSTWVTSFRDDNPNDGPPAVADWTGDGRIDFFAERWIFIGYGNGSFDPYLIPLAGLLTYPEQLQSAFVGDFDGDGITDLATSTGNSIRVALFRPAIATLRLADQYVLESRAVSADEGDVNRDGLNDVLVALDNGSFQVLVGDGSGNLANGETIPVGPDIVAIAAADVTGDGRLDAVVARGGISQSLDVLAGDGRGQFTHAGSWAVGGTPTSLALDDLDQDGAIDAVLALGPLGLVSVLAGTGDGRFESPRSVPVGSAAITALVADLDGDSRNDDIAVGLESGVAVLVGRSGLAWDPPIVIDDARRTTAIAAADWNGDGRTDLFVASVDEADDGSLSILINAGAGRFEPTAQSLPAIGRVPSGIVARDLNGDQRIDVAISAESSDRITVIVGAGDGGVANSSSFGTTINPRGLLAAPLDGDDLPELVTTSRAFSTLDVLQNLSREQISE